MTTAGPARAPDHAAGDGALPPWWTALPRRRLAIALASTLVAVPVVVLDNLPSQDVTRAEAVETIAPAPEQAPTSSTSTSTSTTVTTLPPPSSTTVTVTVPSTTTPAPAPTTTAAPRPTTTTTAPPPPPATVAVAPPAPPAPTPAPVTSESGGASWYRYRDGECAHKTLPLGTVVTVTNPATGASATCVVTDRGPWGGGRIIDLDDGTFAALAPLSAGVIHVTIAW